MKLEHVAIWAADIEKLRDFYMRYFGARSNPLYVNPAKGFSSYFLSFGQGARLELMQMASIPASLDDPYRQSRGIAHIALSVGSESAVDALTVRLERDGYEILDGPRRTGDGYYESVALDPEGNRLEITA